MFKLILRYTFVGLFVAQFVMFVMLVTKLAYEDMPFFLPLPIVTYFAKDLISKWCVFVFCRKGGGWEQKSRRYICTYWPRGDGQNTLQP